MVHAREHRADLCERLGRAAIPQALIRMLQLDLPASEAQKNIGDALHREVFPITADAEQRVFFSALRLSGSICRSAASHCKIIDLGRSRGLVACQATSRHCCGDPFH